MILLLVILSGLTPQAGPFDAVVAAPEGQDWIKAGKLLKEYGESGAP
jgi:hypothetical protein